MADGRHIENRLLARSPRFIVRLTRNFAWRRRITFRHRPRDQNTKFSKFKMADGRHFENGFIAISRPGIIRFWWNLVCWFKFWFKNGHMLIYKKIWNSKWRTAAILKIVFWLYMTRVIVRLMRYLVRTSRIMLRHTPCDENNNFRKSIWRTAAILKNGFITISQPRIIRFQWNLVCHCRFWF